MFPQIFGKYVLEREIAAGGMARVYLATLRGAVGFEKRLVVKQIRSELAVDAAFVRRFVEEAKTAVELSHPNIVPVYELGVEQGVYYIAMEHCPGVTLADVLAYTGPLDPKEGATVGAEVCRALDYAHRRAGIVHRDVTPRNVLVDDEGAVRLIDFGIAAPVEPTSGREREVFGSPGHMPPEQLRGEPLTPAADVFAVAALLIEAFTGTPPFRRGTAEASAEALRAIPPRIDAKLPALAPLADLIARSVALDVKSRPADAEGLGRGLRDFARDADSGEVARRLAARVRRVRDKLERESNPPRGKDASDATSVRDSTSLLVTPAGLAPTTKTFAARDEMVEWTRKLSSAPPPPAEGARGLSNSPSAAPSARPAPPGGPGPRVGRVAALVVGIVLVMGLGSRLAIRSPPPPAPPPAASTPPTVASVVAPVGLPVRAEPADAPPASRPTRAPAPSGPASVQPPNSAGLTPPAPVPSAALLASATLKLTSDPPAMVSIDGQGFSQTSPTPVRALPLSPGAYRLSFRSETYGSPVAGQVTLAPGSRRSVHADFRAAVPTLTVR
jgi:eukaryotic-like serine/threonine-protein kinase